MQEIVHNIAFSVIVIIAIYGIYHSYRKSKTRNDSSSSSSDASRDYYGDTDTYDSSGGGG